MKKTSFLLFLIISMFIACSDDSGEVIIEPTDSGELKFAITDAPIDNAEVKSCVVTVSEIRLDGKKLDSYSKTSIDLLAYQNGKALDLGTYNVEAKNYNTVELILDHESDKDGNEPGCYVETFDGEKNQLSDNEVSIKLENVLQVQKDVEQSFIIDVDLRKSVKSEDNNGETDYEFVSESELKTSVRMVNETKVGVVKGNANTMFTQDGEIIVYAYKKGEFNEDTELDESKDIMFRDAVSSSACDDSGNFEIHFLEEGDYDLYFASYEKDSEGQATFNGMFSIETLISVLKPSTVSVAAQSSTTINVDLHSLLSI